MCKVVEVQYPVGQGGLHLGIIGDVAYMYDCGCRCSRKKAGFFYIYFCDIYRLLVLYKVRKLHFYLSHLHSDHVNLLPGFLQELKIHWHGTVNFYIPQINEPEKIYLLASFMGSQSDYEDYYTFIINPQEYFRRYQMEIESIPLSPTEVLYQDYDESTRGGDGIVNIPNIGTLNWILDPFVEGSTGLKSTIKITDVDTLKKMKALKKQIKPPTSNFHSSMICLYSGPVNKNGIRFRLSSYNYGCCHCYKQCQPYWDCHKCCYLSERIGWLHTGDINLKNNTGFVRYYQRYINYGFVGVMQIPHHCSSGNHDKDFYDNIFNGTNISDRTFYFTYSISGGNAKPHIIDIQNDNLVPISEYSPTFMGTVW